MTSLPSAIDACSEPVKLIRFQPSVVESGRVAKPAVSSETEIFASIQPMTGKDLMLLPEGMRNSGTFKIYSDCELMSVDVPGCDTPDQILSEGVTYQVRMVDNWNSAGGYFKSVLTRMDR